jgi:hypothetical protein
VGIVLYWAVAQLKEKLVKPETSSTQSLAQFFHRTKKSAYEKWLNIQSDITQCRVAKSPKHFVLNFMMALI